LTLTGTDTVASYQAALASVTFDTPSDNPTFFGANPTRTIEWQVDDGSGFDNLSKVATTTVTIKPVNDAPIAADDSYQLLAGNSLHVDADNGMLSTDVDIDSIQLVSLLQDGPAHGQLALNPDGSFDYTPEANFTGIDTFTYVANDGLADSAIAPVSIEVKPSPSGPQDFLLI
jgi:VCBS repeat-containing protein